MAIIVFLVMVAPVQAEPSGKLKARWQKNDTAFRMTHLGDKPWSNCRLSLNPGGFFDDGYTLSVGTINPGQILQLEFRQLTDSDGRRFNTITHKPSQISIWCEDHTGALQSSDVMLH